MRNSPWCLALVMCALAHGPACAADTTAEQLTEIEAETALLKAHERRTEVQAQIASHEAEIAARRAERRRADGAESSVDPVLRGVEGVGRKLYATLELAHRELVDVAAGDSLADGSRVVAVHPREVELLTKAKKRVKLVGPQSVAQDSGAADPAAAPMAPYVPMPMAMPRLPMGAPGGAHP